MWNDESLLEFDPESPVIARAILGMVVKGMVRLEM